MTSTTPWVDPWPTVRAAAETLVDQAKQPLLGIVLGSGLSGLTEQLENVTCIEYDSIEGMPRVGVQGHSGQLIFGQLAGTRVACLSGRAHLYEGHKTSDAVFGVRLLAALGVRTCLLTNAAGGIASRCTPGKLMLITDHINLTGTNPLVGPEVTGFPRFVDMSEAYDQALNTLLSDIAKSRSIEMTSGVYAGLLGPSYETPAEIRMLETFGADAVGMSTVLETIALRQTKVRVAAVSCITNHAAGKSAQPLSHTEVQTVAAKASAGFRALTTEFAKRAAQAPDQ